MKAIYIRRRIMVIAVILGTAWGVHTLMQETSPVCDVPVARAQAGDTMWGMTERNCPKHRHNMEELIHVVISMNNGDTSVQPGQMVVFPWKEEK